MKRGPTVRRLAPSSLLTGLVAALVRPTTPPLSLGIVVAIAFIATETPLVYRLKQVGPEAYGAIFLLGVLVISAGWGFGLAVATSIASAVVYFYFHVEDSGVLVPDEAKNFVALLVFLPVALSANILGRQARIRAIESEQRRHEADMAASTASALADQQAALRRVATLVARGVSPAEIYPTAVAELSRGLKVQNVTLLRYAQEGAHVVVGARDENCDPILPEYLPMDGDNVAALVYRTRAPARMDTYDGATGPTADRIRRLGLTSAVGAPIIVDDRMWGALIVGSAKSRTADHGHRTPHPRLRLPDRDRDRQRRNPRRAHRLARAHRHRCRPGASSFRARSARRRAAARRLARSRGPRR